MHGAMKTQDRSCFYSSFVPRSLRTQMKQITSSRDNLHVQSVPYQGRIAACQVFAGKHTLREGTWHHSYFYFHFLAKHLCICLSKHLFSSFIHTHVIDLV